MLVSGAIIDESFCEGGFDGFGRGRGAFGHFHCEFEEVESGARVSVGEGGEVVD